MKDLKNKRKDDILLCIGASVMITENLVKFKATNVVNGSVGIVRDIV